MESAGRMEIVEELCGFEGRLAGSDAERRACNRLAERLRELGRRAEVEPTYVHPQYGYVHALHCALGFIASLVAIEVPALGFALVLLAATSMYLDLTYRAYLLRRLFFRRASQNVVSPGPRPDAPARVILTAHVDAARTGAIFGPRIGVRFANLANRSPLPLGPFRIVFWSLAALLPLLGLRMAGVDSEIVSVLQLIPTLILLFAAFALAEIDLSSVVGGANDNASGVAAAISLAEQLERDALGHLDVWVVLDGGGECTQEGMRAFTRSRRKRLDPTSTFFINLDSIAAGEVRFQRSGGWATSYGLDRRMLEICEAIAEADGDGDRRYRAAGYASGLGGDALPPRVAGFRSLGITCQRPDGYVPNRHQTSDVVANLDPQAIDRAHDFTLELIRRLDADIGRRRPQ